jgi:hypothetical protein
MLCISVITYDLTPFLQENISGSGDREIGRKAWKEETTWKI